MVVGFFFGPPDVRGLKSRRNIKGLVRALAYPKDSTVRREAALALGEIGAREALPHLASRLETEDSYGVREALVKALDDLAWTPQRDKASAKYWRIKGEFEKCGECGDHGILELLQLVWEGNSSVAEVYPKLGPQAVRPLIAFTDSVFRQYSRLASETSSINYRVRKALEVALANEQEGVSSRKGRIEALIAGMGQ